MVECVKRAPLTYCKSSLSKEQLARIREIEREFHERAFGAELAKVNLDMTIEQRHQYLAWMRKLARKQGVRPEPSPFRFDYLEEEN
jgi:hypothetical protein